MSTCNFFLLVIIFLIIQARRILFYLNTVSMVTLRVTPRANTDTITCVYPVYALSSTENILVPRKRHTTMTVIVQNKFTIESV